MPSGQALYRQKERRPLQNQPHALREVAKLAARLGFTAFGGPAAHIAMLHDEVVVRRQWIDEQHFLDMIGATNLVPGPNSTEMIIHVGYEKAGWRGLIVGGLCFILPAALIVGVLAWAYVKYGASPQGEALLYGIKPVIIAIVLQALYRLGQKAVKNTLLLLVGVAVFGLYLWGFNELVLLFGGGLLVAIIQVWRTRAMSAMLPLLGVGGLSTLMVQTLQSSTVKLDQLFLVFLKIGSLLYGGGYVLLAFLRNDLVLRLGWLTDQQLLDAVAIGQFTPGPLFTTATFVGYILAGVPGAIVATVGIFLPAFCFVAALKHLIPFLRRSIWTAALLDGVNVGALGLMMGVTWQLGRAAIIDWLTALLAVISAAILFRWQINSAWLVLAGAVIGLLLYG
ncbi:MAG: chromate efflux transporter [Caldilineaceae bacterium]|nr:chromate efflux transporter [Caldilineaceae bacterium]MCB9156274.1 chromate efflux transporter [Caldilineaceae bacterium]